MRALNKLDKYSKNNSNNARTKKIRDKFLIPKVEEIERKLYEIEDINNLSKKKQQKIDKNLTELKESFFKLNKYSDDLEYEGIRDIKDLLDKVDEDYYKPIRANNSAFNNNYIEYENKGDKFKNLTPEEYLDMIRPYLCNTINDYKAVMNLRINLNLK